MLLPWPLGVREYVAQTPGQREWEKEGERERRGRGREEGGSLLDCLKLIAGRSREWMDWEKRPGVI